MLFDDPSNTIPQQQRRERRARMAADQPGPRSPVDLNRAAYAEGIQWTLLCHGMVHPDARRCAELIASPAPAERLAHCLVEQRSSGWRLHLCVDTASLDGQLLLRRLRRQGATTTTLLDLLKQRGWPHQRLAA